MSRPLMMVLLVSLSFVLPAQAFQDAQVRGRLGALRSQLSTEQSAAARLQSFENFSDFLDEYIQNTPLPSTANGDVEFASLNEFAVSIFSVDLNPVNAANCRESRNKVISEGSLRERGLENGKVSLTQSARLTVELINLICR